MGEDILNSFGPVEDKMQGIIKVIGVGGGGCNAVRNMFMDGIEGVTYAVCNTDSQSLSRSPVPVKIQLGEGLGAGGNPDVGKKKAEDSIDREVAAYRAKLEAEEKTKARSSASPGAGDAGKESA